jgi:transcriptional regulator with XRE-family HTH domain
LLDVCQIDIVTKSAILACDSTFTFSEKMPDNFNEELGRRIRTARGGKLTQATLGSRIGLSRTAITNIECGRQRLLVDQLVEIAAAIGIPPAELLPPSAAPAAVRNDNATIATMPTVQQWLTTVKKAAARRRA